MDPCPENAPIVKEIFEKYITGRFLYKALAIYANEQKLIDQNKLIKASALSLIERMLKSPIYHCTKKSEVPAHQNLSVKKL